MGKARPKKPRPRRATPQPTTRSTARSRDAGTEVERRWKEYWARRTQLEEAVAKVRAATDALKAAQEAERARRGEFDAIKRTLTTLLDVEPASSVPAREPVALQHGLAEAAPKAVSAEPAGRLPVESRGTAGGGSPPAQRHRSSDSGH